MNKKLMAVAVAGALAAPAMSMAQSTVQVFGDLYVEYSFAKQGTSTAGVDMANPDVLQTPGSQIGFRGEEKLGGGMSAWFTCTSTADFRGNAADGWCTRNSAVGIKGAFGNAFIGNWDTPFKRTQMNVGGRDTGIFGTAFLLMGNSTTVSDGANTGVFKRRQRNSINYDSPNFGGFQVMGAFTSTNSSTSTTASSAGAKPRVWSLGATYKGGPLEIGAGYEMHDKMYGANVANATTSGDGTGWHIGGSYTLGSVKFGGMWTEQEGETVNAAANASTGTVKVKAYQLGAEWKVAGPHSLHFGYTQADDVKGTTGTSMGAVRPTVTNTAALGFDNTGAKLYQIRYLYDFSKRTVGTIGYVNLKNDSAANYELGGVSGQGAGAKASAVAVSLSHKF